MHFHLFLAIELIKDLMDYEVADSLLSGLVALLRPALEDVLARTDQKGMLGNEDKVVTVIAIVILYS